MFISIEPHYEQAGSLFVWVHRYQLLILAIPRGQTHKIGPEATPHGTLGLWFQIVCWCMSQGYKKWISTTYEHHKLEMTSAFLIIMQWRKLKISTSIFRLYTFCETWWQLFLKCFVTENLCNNPGEPQNARLLIIDTSVSTCQGINITPAFYVEQSDVCYGWREPVTELV